MELTVPRHVREHYDADAVLRRAAAEPLPAADARFNFGEFRMPGWRAATHGVLEHEASETQRSIFEDVETARSRVLVDVRVCASPLEAAHALLQLLGTNQVKLSNLGAGELGFAVFAHPEKMPPALFFARSRYCVTVASFGATRVDVLPWAKRIVETLAPGPR